MVVDFLDARRPTSTIDAAKSSRIKHCTSINTLRTPYFLLLIAWTTDEACKFARPSHSSRVGGKEKKVFDRCSRTWVPLSTLSPARMHLCINRRTWAIVDIPGAPLAIRGHDPHFERVEDKLTAFTRFF